MKFLILIFVGIFHLASTQTVYYEGLAVHGKKIVISCDYTAPKEPGSSIWQLVDQTYSQLCEPVPIVADDVLDRNPQCYGDINPNNDAHFAFNLTLDIDRDNGEVWRCALGSSAAFLPLNISVSGTEDIVIESGSTDVEQSDTIEVTATTDCYYPVPPLYWCLSAPGKSTACSDDEDYYHDYFNSKPVVDSSIDQCGYIADPNVKMIESRFKASGAKVTESLSVFAKLDEKTSNVVKFNIDEDTLEVWAISLIVLLVVAFLVIIIILIECCCGCCRCCLCGKKCICCTKKCYVCEEKCKCCLLDCASVKNKCCCRNSTKETINNTKP